MMRSVQELLGEGVCIAVGASRSAVAFDVEVWDELGGEREHRQVELEIDEAKRLVLHIQRAMNLARAYREE